MVVTLCDRARSDPSIRTPPVRGDYRRSPRSESDVSVTVLASPNLYTLRLQIQISCKKLRQRLSHRSHIWRQAVELRFKAGFGGNFVNPRCFAHCPTFIASSISSTGLPRFILSHSASIGEYSQKQITTRISVVGEANS